MRTGSRIRSRSGTEVVMRTAPALLLLVPQARVPDVPARASIRRTRTARQPQPKDRPQTTEAVLAAATCNRGLGWVRNWPMAPLALTTWGRAKQGALQGRRWAAQPAIQGPAG